jgi:hypothetical protein
MSGRKDVLKMAKQNTDDKTEDIDWESAAPGVNGNQKIAMYRVPATVDDMKPPKSSSLITEAANFLRAHWSEVKPYYQAISGEAPSLHGSGPLDEAACVFEIQRIAKENGFAFLGSVQTYKLRRALRWGFKRNTGVPMGQLEAQYKRLHKQITKQP